MSKHAHSGRHATVASRRTNIPVLPTVIATHGDPVTPGIGACKSHCTGRSIRTIFSAADHLRTRHHFANFLCHFHFYRMRKRKNYSLLKLRLCGGGGGRGAGAGGGGGRPRGQGGGL